MNQKYFRFLIVILVVAVVVPTIVSAAWWNPFSWGMWNRIFHFQRAQQQNVVCTQDAKQCPDGSYVSRQGPKCEFKACPEPKIVGGDKDSHGCRPSAGYTWCEAKKKCLRSWEEKCEVIIPSGWKTYKSNVLDCDISLPDNWMVVWEMDGSLHKTNENIFNGEPNSGVMTTVSSPDKKEQITFTSLDYNNVQDCASSQFIINGQQVNEYFCPNHQTGTFPGRYFDKFVGKNLLIGYDVKNDTIDKIISLIKFIK